MGRPHTPIEDIEQLALISQLLASSSVDTVVYEAIKVAARIAEVDRGSLLVRMGSAWRLISLRPVPPEHEAASIERILRDGLGGWVVKHQESVLIMDTLDDDRWTQLDPNVPIRSALSVPVVFRDRLLGAITLSHEEPRHFDEYHLRLMTIVANQTATAIHNAQTISRLQAQEEQVRAVLEAVPDVLLVLDGAGRVLLASDAIFQLLDGMTPSELTGRPVSDLVDIDPVFTPMEKLARGSVPEYGEWSMEVRSDKRKRDFLVNISVWDSTEEAGYVVVMKDITTLRDLTRFKDNMMNITLHDLASPLNLVLNSASLLKDDLEHLNDPGADYFITSIVQSATRMQSLIEKMRLLERIRSSPLEMVESVDLPMLARETVDDHRAQAESKGIALESHYDAIDVPAIMGNPIMLKQAMENLVSNAIKYTRKGGTVRVYTAVHDERHFYFEVTDSGIGIGPEDMTRVFEPFFRATNVSAGDKGTGLGLSLVRSIVEQHNGQVGVESEVGVGSRFWLALPIMA